MKKALILSVLNLLFFMIQGQPIFAQKAKTSHSQSIAAPEIKPTICKHTHMTLLAGTGFNDGNNWVNMYGTDLYFIHGNDSFGDANTGWFQIPFAGSVPAYAQLGISLSHLEIGKAFTVHLRIWANLGLENYNDSCTFYVRKDNNSGGSIFYDTIPFKEAHLPIHANESKDLIIHIKQNEVTQTGNYYIFVNGCYKITTLWYEISLITLTYD